MMNIITGNAVRQANTTVTTTRKIKDKLLQKKNVSFPYMFITALDLSRMVSVQPTELTKKEKERQIKYTTMYQCDTGLKRFS